MPGEDERPRPRPPRFPGAASRPWSRRPSARPLRAATRPPRPRRGPPNTGPSWPCSWRPRSSAPACSSRSSRWSPRCCCPGWAGRRRCGTRPWCSSRPSCWRATPSPTSPRPGSACAVTPGPRRRWWRRGWCCCRSPCPEGGARPRAWRPRRGRCWCCWSSWAARSSCWPRPAPHCSDGSRPPTTPPPATPTSCTRRATPAACSLSSATRC